MSLPNYQDLKDYLRIETDAEDDLCTALVASATGLVQTELGRPIVKQAARTWREFIDTERKYDRVRQFRVPMTPLDPTTLVITDVDGTTLTSTDDYFAPTNPYDGVIRARPGIVFANGPYDFAADVGLSVDSDYATMIEPVLKQAILDTAADLYQRRNPNASQESAGGGITTSYAAASGMPQRARDMIANWKLPRIP